MEFNLAQVHEAIAGRLPRPRMHRLARPAPHLRASVAERTRRLANYLLAAGLGCHTERSELGGHESGQDHLALYLYNGNEYLEAMLGCVQGAGRARST